MAELNEYVGTQGLAVTLSTKIAGEDLTNDVQKVEQRYSYFVPITTDTLVKSGAGVLHTLTFTPTDGTPTAGTIDVYDNTAASGTKIYTFPVQAVAFTPFTIHFDCSFSTGLYIDFTTTADVSVSGSYR